jgi:phage-related baseplate assembly protein
MSRLSVINLDLLPRMQVLESISSDKIIADRMARFRVLWNDNDPPNAAQYDVGALEFDPIKIQHECGAYFETMIRDRVNQAARAVTLAFASGSDLDAIASRYPGGVPRAAGEKDANYRRRVWLSPNTLGPHGTAEAYVFWALTGDSTLHDASATTDEGTGKVYVTLMAESGSVADMPWVRTRDPLSRALIKTEAVPVININPSLQQIIDVRKYILDEGRRGQTDEIITYQPQIVPINYKARIWMFPNASVDITITAVEKAVAALIENQRWLGYDHSRMAFDAALAQTGVHHAVIDEPATDVNVDDRSVVKVDLASIAFAGVTE